MILRVRHSCPSDWISPPTSMPTTIMMLRMLGSSSSRRRRRFWVRREVLDLKSVSRRRRKRKGYYIVRSMLSSSYLPALIDGQRKEAGVLVSLAGKWQEREREMLVNKRVLTC